MVNHEEEAVLSMLNDNKRAGTAAELSALLSMNREDAFNEIDSLLEKINSKEVGLNNCGKVNWSLSSVTLINSHLKDYLDIMTYYHSRLKILNYWDTKYPEVLRQIPDPPAIIYVQGTVFPGTSPIAIVGTRRTSRQGEVAAYNFAKSLASNGHTIISGLALGIDTMAHLGALDAGGCTIAVLGTDIESLHPYKNLKLAKEIALRGSLVSEITKRGSMYKKRFVERNRITSGLSRAILVAETPGSGGTFTQVMHARRQKRPVFVVEQHTFSSGEYKEGFRSICQMGGIPVSTPEELESHLKEVP